jgi:hypothetical protein
MLPVYCYSCLLKRLKLWLRMWMWLWLRVKLWLMLMLHSVSSIREGTFFYTLAIYTHSV